MRRSVLATAAVLLLAAPASAARPSPNGSLRDATGDWPLASQDIVSAQVFSGRGALRAVLTLAEASDAVGEYTVTLSRQGCDAWSLVTRGGSARLRRTTCDPVAVPVEIPATTTVSGKQVVVSTPYALGLTKGTRFEFLGATASPYLTGVGFGGSFVPTMLVMTGDIAWADVNLVLG